MPDDDSRIQRATTLSTAGVASDTEGDATKSARRDVAPAGTSEHSAPYDDYVVSGEHGRGGLGRVLRAHDRRLGRLVALKELLHGGRSAAARFTREARLTARLQHPSIVPIYELGTRDDGSPFYAMKFVAGERLDHVVRRTRTLDERLALMPVVLAVADAVAYAHEHKIIHRDLKPANVMVGSFGETVVIDWGLAKDLSEPDDALDDEASVEPPATAERMESPAIAVADTLLAVDDSARTAARATMGTLAYMPPEQLASARVDERADVFAIGALLYHVLTGVPPYAAATSEELHRIVEDAAPEPVDEREPGVPRELAAIVRKAMQRRVSDRYPSAIELALDLRRFQTGQLVDAHRYTRAALARRWLATHRRAVIATLGVLVMSTVFGVVSVRRIIHERSIAQSERARAEAERARAESRAEELTLVEARESLDRDPTASLAWLKTSRLDAPSWARVASIAADARARGIARHVLRGQPGSVSFLGVSKDGRRVVSGGDADGLYVWDAALGRLHAHRETGFHTTDLVILDEGALAAGRSGDIALVTDSGVRTFRGHRGRVVALAVAPDRASFASCSDDGTVRAWNIASGEGRILGKHDAVCTGVSFAPDGARVASTGSDGRLVLWSVRGDAARVLSPAPVDARPSVAQGSAPMIVEWSPRGDLVAVAEMAPREIRIFDVATGTSAPLRGHDAPIQKIGFTKDGARLVSASRDGTARVWDPVRRTLERILSGHTATVESFDLARDGRRLVTCSEDTTARIWDLVTGDAVVLRGHRSPVLACAFAADGRTVVTGSADSTTRVWSIGDSPERALSGHAHDVYALAFAADGRRLASGGHDNSVRVWDLAAGKHDTFLGHDARVTSLAFLGDGSRLASVSRDRTLRVWTLADRTSRVFRHDAAIHAVVATRAGDAIVTASADETVRVWPSDGGEALVLRGHRGRVDAIALSPDESRIASAGEDRTVRIWDRRTGASLHVLRGHAEPVAAVAFADHGASVVSASWDDTVRVWSVASGELVRELRGHRDRVRALAVAPDGRHVASGSNDDSIRVWDIVTGESVALEGHEDWLRTLAFSPDGALLLSSSNDHTARLWDVRRGRLRAVHRADASVMQALFSPDGGRIAFAGWDRLVRVRAIDPADLLPMDPDPLRAWLDDATTAIIQPGGTIATLAK